MHRWLDSLADPRQQGKVVYPLRLLVLAVLLQRLSGSPSGRRLEDDKRGRPLLLDNLNSIAGTRMEHIPHSDTINLFVAARWNFAGGAVQYFGK